MRGEIVLGRGDDGGPGGVGDGRDAERQIGQALVQLTQGIGHPVAIGPGQDELAHFRQLRHQHGKPHPCEAAR